MKKFLLIFIIITNVQIAKADDTVTVYSSRKAHLIKPLFDKFTEDTGMQVHKIYFNQLLVKP